MRAQHQSMEVPLTGTAADEWELLDRQEGSWRPLLQGVSLVAEADIDPEASRPVLAALGYVYLLYKRSSQEDKLRAFRHWAACVAVGMTGIAAADYEEGTYWPKLWAAVGYPGSAQDQYIWGTSFRDALRELGLPAFPATRQRHLGPILMHCGIPTHCLKDLLRVMAEHARRDPGMDASSLIAWMTEAPSRMMGLDKPVQSLIREGREYAYDIIDRLIELLNRLRDPVPDMYGIGLPDRLVREACSLVTRKTVTLSASPHGRSHRRLGDKPRLVLDPFGSGPEVVLPSVEGIWRITVDGDPTDIRVSPGRDSGDTSTTAFPLPRPTRNVQVTLLGSAEPPTLLTIVRDEDPLLVFSEDGEFLPLSQPLPSTPVWVLYQEDFGLVRGREAHVICEGEVPFGWDRWILREIDLAGVGQLGVSEDHAREVRGTGQPRLVLEPPVPGVSTAHHQPVYRNPPMITLPDGDLARTWWIEVRKEISGGGAKPVRMTTRSGVVDPWRDLDRPVTGTFEIAVTGPLGFRLYRRVCLAEGLSIRYEPAVRLLTRTGLDRADAFVTGPVAPGPSRLTFGEDQVEATVTYGDAKLSIAPPHLSVLRDDGTNRARWSAKALHLDTESFTGRDPGLLLVRGPDTLRIPPLTVVSGDVTQDIHSSGVHHDGRARYRLAQIKDTIAAVRRADLVLRLGERTVPVALVRPHAFATGAEWVGGQLRLAGYQQAPGLRSGIYQVYAPWHGVTVLPVRDDGVVPLPSRLREPGPIRVYLAQVIAGSPWPRWPPGESLLVHAPGRPAGEDAADRELVAFLAGDGPCPGHVQFERLWLIDALADILMTDGAREDLRRQCDMGLRSDPVGALIALSRARLDPAEAVTALVRTSLASLRPDGRVAPEETRYLWTRLPPVAAILSGRVLSDRSQVAELLGVMATDLGAAAAGVLRGENDPLAPAWGASAGRSLAPGALIDPARVMAELEQQADPEFTRKVPQLASDAVALLAQTPYRGLARRIGARPEGPLRLSAALSLAARAGAASGSRGLRFQRQYRPFWSEFAQAFPDLVALDIVVAQAAVSAVDRR
jgi:hypothetical protein